MKTIIALLSALLSLTHAQDNAETVAPATVPPAVAPVDLTLAPAIPSAPITGPPFPLSSKELAPVFPFAPIGEPPTIAPAPTNCPPVPDNGCTICGDGLCVGSPDEIFAFPGFPAVGCGLLQQAGYDGVVPLDQCLFLPGLVKEVCLCYSGSGPLPPTSAPVPTVPVEPPVPPTSSETPAMAPVTPTTTPSSAMGLGTRVITVSFCITILVFAWTH